ncbi:MAG: FtsX-like permease family protein [Clostridia bacterium]|nr:FtsX-like permease family protein [Clostridia bacterium]
MRGFFFRAICKKYWKLLLSMLLVSAFGCATLTGLAGGFLSLKEALDFYVQEGGYPDALVTTDVTELERMDALKAVAGVAEVNARLIGDLVLINGEGRYLSIRAMSFDEDEFQTFYFWERAEQNAHDPIYLEYNFAKIAGIRAGDTVRVKVGGEFRQYAVAGIVSRPETLSMEPSDSVRISSEDFGYAYAPRSLLAKEVNPEHRDALAEWQAKSGELAEAEESARQEYENALAELDSAEAELNEKKAEFEEKRLELDGQQAELDRSKEELEQARQELNEKTAEAESSQRELNEKRAEAEAKQAELEQAQRELAEKRAELEETEKTLLEQRDALIEQREEARAQLASLQSAKEELLEGQKTLEKERAKALDKRWELNSARSQLVTKRAEVEQQLAALRLAKGYLSRLNQAVEAIAAESGFYQQTRAAIEELDRLLADTEAMKRRIEQAQSALASVDAALTAAENQGLDTVELLAQRQEIVNGLAAVDVSEAEIGSKLAQLRASIAEMQSQRAALQERLSALQDTDQLQNEADALRNQLKNLAGGLTDGGNVSESMLNSAIEQATDGLKQIDSGISQIDYGLRLIRDGLKQADEKEAELNDGLAQMQEGEALLNDALAQMDDGLRQMDEGFQQIADGYREMDDFQAQIDSGSSELAEGFAQIADYQAQLDEGFAQIRAGEEEIDAALAQIEDGETQIADAIADAERQIADGENQIKDTRTGVENGWIEALAEFSDLENELNKTYEELSEWEGYQVFCNQFLLRFSPDASPEAVLENVNAALAEAGVEVKSTVLYESSPINRRINNNLIPIETMANFIPMIFFAIAMIVVYLFMSLMIRQCRREIGILRALGFTRFRVVSLFCGAGLLVSLGAVAFGLAVSLAVRGYFVHYFFDILLPLPVHVLVFSWPKFLLSAVLTLAAVETSTVVSALSISGIQPSEAMTRLKPSTVKIPRFVRWALRGASPFLKFSVISLLRNRLRFLFSVVCLAGSVMLIFTSRSLVSSTNEILDRTFTRSIHYDCQIFISEKGADDLQRAVAALPYVSDVERMDYYTASFFLNGHSESAKVAVVQENTRLLSVEDQKRNVLPITGDGVVLEKHLAERLGASIGDTVEVNGAPLRVSAVSEQCAARFQYMAAAQAQALGNCTQRSLICRVPAEYESEFMGFLVEQDGYLYAVFTHSVYSSCLYLLEGANLACWMLIGIAMIIGLVIVVNTSQTNLLEQKRELCVLRTLGFQHGELSLYWFAQSLLHFLYSCVLGFPAGIAMAKRAIQNMEMELYTYTFVNNPWDYAVTAGLVFAYIVFSHFLSMRSLRRWDIVECVKDKE